MNEAEQKEKAFLEEEWLLYFNRYLLDKRLISEDESREMTNLILQRGKKKRDDNR